MAKNSFVAEVTFKMFISAQVFRQATQLHHDQKCFKHSARTYLSNLPGPILKQSFSIHDYVTSL